MPRETSMSGCHADSRMPWGYAEEDYLIELVEAMEVVEQAWSEIQRSRRADSSASVA